MKKIILILMAITFMGCTYTEEYERIDYLETNPQIANQQEDPLKFSSDPLLDSVYRARYLNCLKNCSDKDCD